MDAEFIEVAAGLPATGVQLRLMGDDPAAVEAVARLLAAVPGVVITAWAPCRRGPGLRVYGAVVVPS